MNTAYKLIGTLVISLSLVSCSSSIKLDEAGAPIESRSAPSSQSQAPSQGTSTAPASDRAVQTVTLGSDPRLDPNNPLSRRSIYFDFDSFEIRDEFRSVIDAHAKYLLANKSRRVLISGNTDERGSREYNLALGQKRAEAVRRALAALGVPDSQMEAVSYGEEKPRSTESSEAAWAENRRADLEYSGS